MQADINVVVRRGGFSTVSFPTPEAYLQGTKTEWVSLALTDLGMLNGLLVSACRSLHSLYGGGPYLEYALRYKMACIVDLNRAITGEGSKPRDSTIAKAIILASDEVPYQLQLPLRILELISSFLLRSPLAIFWPGGNTLKPHFEWLR